MKVLLTGTMGDIGRDLLPSLRLRHEVVGLDRREGADLVVDLCDREAVREAVEGFDAIVHFAALIGSAAHSSTAEYVDANVKATGNLLEAAAEHGIARFVYTSTVWASGHGPTEPYQPIDEDVPCAPVCRYGLTKLMGEDLCRYYARLHGVEATVLRICGYYRPSTGCLAPDGAIDWTVHQPAEIAGRHVSMPNFKLYSPDDMAEAVDRALTAPWHGCEAYIIGCYAPYTADDREGLATDPLSVIARYYPGAPDFFVEVGLAPKPFTFWHSFEKAKAQGKVRHYGITMHRHHKAIRRAIETGLFETIMLAYNPLDEEGTGPDLIPLAAEHDMGIIIMKPLSGGILVSPPDMPRVDGMDPIVAGTLRAIASHPQITTVIPGMVSIDEVTCFILSGVRDALRRLLASSVHSWLRYSNFTVCLL